ncbi:MAG: ABC transporter ATP-binding protein [Candidatus Syntrophonatronum acetioxidans]|uniref:ABC transporter ATP-binding protein n=1 Tax=Candidatus Syntrophonatronum acetioxidans TaxID=1795816 RepID=A0A424YHJ2_9FIRM|nr:MAG: ABC transporter ATP-binding protein [Candidatus Syntrophonatronum acetioxidans]
MDLHVPELGYQKKPEKMDYRLLFRLLKNVWPYRLHLLGAFIMMLLTTGATLAGPYIIKVAIDTAIIGQNLEQLNILAFLFVLTYGVNWFSSYGQNYLMSWVGQKVIFDMRQRIFDHLQKLGFKFFDRRSTGEVMSRVTNDVEALNEFISWGIIHVAGDLVIIIGIIVVMISEHLLLALVSFVTFPFFILVSTLFRNRVIDAYRQVRSRMAEVNSHLQENISGFKVIQSFVRERKNIDDFSSINNRNLQANMKAATLFAIYLPVIEVIGAVGTAILVWYGGMEVVRGAIQIGTLYLFLDYLSRFYAPLRDLSQIYNNLQSALAAGERYFEIMDTRPHYEEDPEALVLPFLQGRVKFEGVTFAYEKGKNVLEDINLDIEPGEAIALIGPTGAGKTTLINLLYRFYEPQKGRIFIDGNDIKKIKIKSLRDQMSLALQDTFLFSGTILENISYGRPDASREEIEEAARSVYIHDFISSLPEGYDTFAGERGSSLSMGQRQLISFARVLLRNPRIIVLDEATSSVDAHTEEKIQNALKKITADRTSFIIAHRLSTIKKADRILVLDKGRLVQQGSPRELAEKPGLYRELLQLQFEADYGEEKEKSNKIFHYK